MTNFLKTFARYAVARGKEPSTYAGLAAGAAALGYSVDPGMLQTLAMVGVAASSAAAVALKG